MRKVIFCVLLLIGFSAGFASDFLMIYPDGYAVKGNTIHTEGIKAQIDVPDTWLSDSFVSDPYPVNYVYVDQKPFDLSEVLSSYVGQTIKWRFSDGNVKSYTFVR
jgi:hypothetical protein